MPTSPKSPPRRPREAARAVSASPTGDNALQPRRRCLSETSVLAFVARSLSPIARTRVEAHMAECAACRQLVSCIARMELRAT